MKGGNYTEKYSIFICFQMPPIPMITKDSPSPAYGPGSTNGPPVPGSRSGLPGGPGPGNQGSSPDSVILAVPPVEKRRKSTPKNAFNRSPRGSKAGSYSSASDFVVSLDIYILYYFTFHCESYKSPCFDSEL